MKLTSRDLISFYESPPKGVAGVLIYGNDQMRVANKRQKLIHSLLGPKADEEMRLTRISRENLKKAPEQAIDLCKAQGFFPGQRALLIEEANETITDIIIKVFDVWKDGDATLIVTAGSLKPASNLRKFFEQQQNTFSAPIYDSPMTRAEIEKIRGKPVFRGTLDSLLELKWIKPHGRRETPGRPVTWVTDYEFLKHFGLSSIKDLPKVDELESIIL